MKRKITIGRCEFCNKEWRAIDDTDGGQTHNYKIGVIEIESGRMINRKLDLLSHSYWHRFGGEQINGIYCNADCFKNLINKIMEKKK